jgi:hypothetical protein
MASARDGLSSCLAPEFGMRPISNRDTRMPASKTDEPGPTRMRVIEARRFLSGGLITFGDGLRLHQGRHKFRPGHQCSGMAGLDCATRRNRYGDGSHALACPLSLQRFFFGQ